MIPPMAYPDATFLDYAADVKKRVRIPVIAVGRLGDPERATDAVASGKADFVALGRTLIADPDWVEKLRRGEPARRCLACNTCVNEMRGGSQLHCVVNGAAGQERSFEIASMPKGERIAVIGAGPAGLTYASLVARRTRSPCSSGRLVPAAHSATPARRRCSRRSSPTRIRSTAPLRSSSLRARKGVTFCYGIDVARTPELLAPFDRIVIATGAQYRFGLGRLPTTLLDWGAGRWPVLAPVFACRPSATGSITAPAGRPAPISVAWPGPARKSL